MSSTFVTQCLQSDDDTVWRAGKMIQELQEKLEQANRERVELFNELRVTFSELQGMHFEHEGQIRYLGVIRARREAKELPK